MIRIDTNSEDVFYNFGCELYFASEKILPEDVFLMWRTTPTLMIGKYQNTLEEIDAAYARERGIRVVRRLSGGGTIYTDRGGWQFTYITRSVGMEIEFSRFIDPIVDALRSFGLDAEQNGRNDITVDGKKVSGNAQFRLGPVTVHHGSLLFETDLSELARATTPKPYKIESKAIASVRDRVTNIRDALPPEFSSLTMEEFRREVLCRMTAGEYRITPEDDGRIRELADGRFRDERVIYAAVPRFEMEKDIHTPGGTFRVGVTVKKGKIESAGVTGDFFADPAAAEELSGALTGIEFTPEAVLAALRPCEGRLYGADAGMLTRGIFE